MVKQVKDDPELLEMMLDGLRSAPESYRPTNYWSVYAGSFVPELRKLGLHDFRRRKRSVLPSFGASDIAPRTGEINLFEARYWGNRLLKKIPFWIPALDFGSRFLNRCFVSPLDLYDASRSSLQERAIRYCELKAKSTHAKPLSDIEASLAGNPEDTFELDGRTYTMSFLYYYLRYVFCSATLDFENLASIVELGSGAGKQVEVLKKLYPRLCFYLFDIPPQLYVCEQFLKALFPRDVISYRDTCSLEALPEPEAGKILILPTWQYSLLESHGFDLFWNACSFQEMEPEAVSNYLGPVNNNAKAVFLQQLTRGMMRAPRPGQLGVLQPTNFEDYARGLPNFPNPRRETSERPLDSYEGHTDSLWLRRS